MRLCNTDGVSLEELVSVSFWAKIWMSLMMAHQMRRSTEPLTDCESQPLGPQIVRVQSYLADTFLE